MKHIIQASGEAGSDLYWTPWVVIDTAADAETVERALSRLSGNRLEELEPGDVPAEVVKHLAAAGIVATAELGKFSFIG